VAEEMNSLPTVYRGMLQWRHRGERRDGALPAVSSVNVLLTNLPLLLLNVRSVLLRQVSGTFNLQLLRPSATIISLLFNVLWQTAAAKTLTDVITNDVIELRLTFLLSNHSRRDI